MQWDEVREMHPDRWLVIEALEAHTTETSQRILDRIAVIEECPDSSIAWRRCWKLNRENRSRELYAVSTRTAVLDIEEGFRPIRFHDATHSEP